MPTESDIKSDRRELRRGCLILAISLVLMAIMLILVKGHWKYSNNRPEVKMLRTGAANWNAWRESNRVALRFERSDLSNLDIGGANLAGAVFSGTYGIGSDLSGATLHAAILTDARLAYSLLVGTDLSRAVLRDASFSFSNLSGANLSFVDGRRSRFREANLSKADLRGSNFAGASFLLADLTGAQLEGIDFTAAYLVHAKLSEVKDWNKIKSIECANVFGVIAPYGFKEWALERGALEYEWDDSQGWKRARAACLENARKN